jgi:hypothetical protein
VAPLKALIVALLVLTVLLLIPLGIDGGYRGGKRVLGIRAGLFNIRVFPRRFAQAPLKLKKSAAGVKPVKKRPEKKAEMGLDEILDLAAIGLKALGRLRKKLHVDYLRLRCTCASDDPFVTAMGFAGSSAVLGGLLPLIDEAFDISERDIGTRFDFLSTKPYCDFWLTTTIHVWEILYVAIAFGIDYLRLKAGHKQEDRI